MRFQRFRQFAAVLLFACLTSSPALAHGSRHGNVPIYATFGFQWTPMNYFGGTEVDPNDPDPTLRVTETQGAARLHNGKVVAFVTRDELDIVQGHITSDYAILMFSPEDWVYTEYDHIQAGYDPVTNTASFGGALTVTGGEGRFAGATGNLTIRSKVLFWPMPSVGVFEIKGVIKTQQPD